MNTMNGILMTVSGERKPCVIHNWHGEVMMVQTDDFIGKVHISQVEIEFISVLDEIHAKYNALEANEERKAA